MKTAQWACLLGQPQFDGYRAVCDQLRETGLPVSFLESQDWEQLTARVGQAQIPIVSLCGLLYRRLRAAGCPLQAIASPVLNQARYSRPVYWSEVVVRADSKITTLEQLRGKRWLYNETESCSGFRSFLAELVKLGLGSNFLGEREATGSHARSLELLAAGEGDFSVIDSTVLDYVPVGLRARFRVVHSVGPMPAPLLACLPGYEEQARAVLRLSNPPAPFTRFQAVDHSDYEVLERDWNLTRELLGSTLPSPPFVTDPEGWPGREFTSESQARADQAVLDQTLSELWPLIGSEPNQEIPGGKFYFQTEDGLQRHTYVMQPDKLNGSNMAIVGFFSRMKPDVDLPALFEADAKIVAEFHRFPGLLIYAPKEYAPGVWGNLAIFESNAAQREWVSNAPHLAAIRDLTESSYANIRLHVGVWRSRKHPLEWVATKYIQCDPEGMWRGVRTYSPALPSLSR